MVTVRWCKLQGKGIKVVEPNKNLCKEYMQTAEESLAVLKDIKRKSKVWLAVTKYYAEYFAFYSLLMNIGVKCEIHDCTIELCRMMEKKGLIPKGFTETLEYDKKLRIDNQYYLKNREVNLEYDEVLNFILQIKELNLKLTQKDIEKIRKDIKNC